MSGGRTTGKTAPPLTSPTLLRTGTPVRLGDAATWLAHTSGTGTVTTGTDSAMGDYIRIATTAQAAYRVGRDLPQRFDAGRFLSFKLRRNDTNLSVFDLWLGVDAYSTSKGPSWNKGVTNLAVGEVRTITVPLAEYESLNGAIIDPFDVRILSLRFTPGAGTDTSVDISDLRIHDGVPAPGQVSFVFDDGRLDTYTQGFQLLKAKGYPAGIAVEHTAVGNADRCSLAQLKEMYAAGWDMYGHHTAQMTGLSETDQITVHRASKAFLSSNGFKRGDKIWVWPGGARSSATETLARRYWNTMRRVNSFTVFGQPHVYEAVDPPVAYITKNTTQAQARAQIDRVALYGGHLTIAFHSLVNALSANEDWLISDFSSLLDYIQTKGVKVVPVSQAWTQ